MFEQREAFLAHSITTHKLVIGDVELISDLSSYVAYWRVLCRGMPSLRSAGLFNICVVTITFHKIEMCII